MPSCSPAGIAVRNPVVPLLAGAQRPRPAAAWRVRGGAAQDRQADKNRDAALADRDALWARQDKLLADANAREDAKITDSRSYEQQRLDEARAYEEKLRQERFQRMKPATGLLALARPEG